MPTMVQACSLNPYYAVILELLTSLVKGVHGCSEVEKAAQSQSWQAADLGPGLPDYKAHSVSTD